MAALTHPGRVRSHNEDCVAADANARVAVLADGMGGHNAGEVASRMAVELVISELTRHPEPLDATRAEALIAAQIAHANSAVLQAAAARRDYYGMGTTLVVLVWHDDGISFGHVGDSRLYVLRGGELQQLTRDHSLVQEQLERGALSHEQARFAPHRNVLTRAVGIGPVVRADVRSWPSEAGDLYLLCSDGLTDMLTDQEIEKSLRTSNSSLEDAALRLVEQANLSGGIDNISVILARARPSAAERPV